LLLAAFFLLAACVPMMQKAREVEIKTAFDPKEHDPYLKSGNNTVTGRAYMHTLRGEVVTCAGREVMMLPATSFFREAIEIGRTGKLPKMNEKIPVEYRSIMRPGKCDSQGNFVIRSLPDGNWFVLTQIKWTERGLTQGGDLAKEVRLSGGKTVEVVLTDKDQAGF